MTSIRVQALGVVAGLLVWSAPARAQSCVDDPAAVAPIAPSPYSPKYMAYKGRTIALVGMSHEYLCHVAQPQRVGQYCTLGNYATEVLPNLQSQKNTLIRLWAVFHHSPGREAYGTPFTNEQPFKYNSTTGKWDLNVVDNADVNVTNLNVAYYTNLERVVHEAFCRGIIVEVTLLDPWCGTWTMGPFHTANTTDGKGFSERRLFMSFENLTGKSDTSAQNIAARNAQKVAAAQVVRRLKRFPNVIFEVANEPDLIPSGLGITPTHTTDLQNTFVSLIQTFDNPAPANHLIMVNGHQTGAFAWSVPGAKVGSGHYTNISDSRYGATELMRNASLRSARANHAVGFNEGKAIGGGGVDPVTADDLRSEAWEFSFNEGAFFDGYSINRSDGNTINAVTQLGVLRKFLADPGNLVPGPYIWSLANMQQTSCNGTGNWCRNVPAWGNSNNLCAPNGDGKTYWATFKSDSQYALYLHHGALVNNPPSGSSNPFQRYDARVCASPLYTLPNFQFQVFQTGCWIVRWINPKDGAVVRSATFEASPGVWYATSPPAFTHDIVALALLFRAGTCY
ncbi:MAG TPA: hypothetical protein VF121_07820 [Thermoanaerobaculia bacterium]|nr:hypothetical protein [Thermoanaerobaculia bacterium]